MKRIALVVSHPIQHFCPQYVSFARHESVVFKAFFASALGYKKYVDPNFKQEISWGNLNLDQFDHEFLNGEVVIKSDGNLDAPRLELSLEKFKPDLVIIYGYFQKLQRRAHRWATKNRIPLGYISDSELRHRKKNLREFIKGFYIRRYFSRISYFLSVGDANEEFYRHYGVAKERILRMHFPIDIIQYKQQFEVRNTLREKIRARYEISTDTIVLSVVGKLASWKNQDHIVDAMSLLEMEGLIVNLFILGSGDMMENWKMKASLLSHSKVFFTGFVSIDELPAYYAATDIYVHPASIEPHSIAVSEAIYMGCPIILSDRCGSYGDTDDVQTDKNGYVFEFGNIRQLANTIKSLALDAPKRTEFGKYSHNISTLFQKSAHNDIMSVLLSKLDNNTTSKGETGSL